LHSEKEGWLVSNLPSITEDITVNRVMSRPAIIKQSSLDPIAGSPSEPH